MAQQTQDDIDREKAAQMRQMLAAENREAVAHRFGEDSLQSAEFRQAEKDLAQQRSQARKRREEAMAGDADVAQEQVAQQAAQQQRDAQMEAQRQAELEAQRQAEAERQAQLEREQQAAEQQRQVEQTQQEQVEYEHEERQSVEDERDRREHETEKKEKKEVQQKAEQRGGKDQSPASTFSAKVRAAQERDAQDRGLGR